MKTTLRLSLLLLSALLATLTTVPKALAAPDTHAEATAPVGPFFDPVVRDIEGWAVHIDPNLLSSEMTCFRRAMAAPAEMPGFKGNVAAVETAPFWSDELGAIDEKRGQVRQMRHFLDSNHKDHANADGKMTEEQKREYLVKYEADLISPAEVALWERGASNAGFHYLGCAKTFAMMGRAFAEANLRMLETKHR